MASKSLTRTPLTSDANDAVTVTCCKLVLSPVNDNPSLQDRDTPALYTNVTAAAAALAGEMLPLEDAMLTDTDVADPSASDRLYTEALTATTDAPSDTSAPDNTKSDADTPVTSDPNVAVTVTLDAEPTTSPSDRPSLQLNATLGAYVSDSTFEAAFAGDTPVADADTDTDTDATEPLNDTVAVYSVPDTADTDDTLPPTTVKLDTSTPVTAVAKVATTSTSVSLVVLPDAKPESEKARDTEGE